MPIRTVDHGHVQTSNSTHISLVVMHRRTPPMPNQPPMAILHPPSLSNRIALLTIHHPWATANMPLLAPLDSAPPLKFRNLRPTRLIHNPHHRWLPLTNLPPLRNLTTTTTRTANADQRARPAILSLASHPPYQDCLMSTICHHHPPTPLLTTDSLRANHATEVVFRQYLDSHLLTQYLPLLLTLLTGLIL